MNLKPFGGGEELPNGMSLGFLIGYLESLRDSEAEDIEASGTIRGPRHDRMARFEDAIQTLNEIDNQ